MSGERPNDFADLGERHVEDVVQHESDPLARAQRLEHDQQRRPDRVGQQHLVLGAKWIGPVRAWFGQAHPGGIFSARTGGSASASKTHPGHHGGEPPADVLDAARVRAAEAYPGFLHGVVGGLLGEPSMR